MLNPGSRRASVSRFHEAETLVWLNITLIWVWFGLHTFIGDRIGAIGALDMFAMYYFLPLALAFPLLIYRRAFHLCIASAVSLLLFAWVWHGLFLPRASLAVAPAPALRVMTFNVLGTQDDYQSSIDNIVDAHADVVFLQEVNPDFAAIISRKLSADFPYQVLAPRPGVNGMATISRFPLRETGESLGLVWVGIPQLLTVDWNGTQLGLVNFHTLPPRLSWEEYMRDNFRIRNEQARAISAYIDRHVATGPMVCAGDLNAVQISTAYRTLRTHLNDAWLDGAIGTGNTFPNHTTVPPRMFRIDYILPSSQLSTLRAFLARSEGGSDHRGVVADLVMAKVHASE